MAKKQDSDVTDDEVVEEEVVEPTSKASSPQQEDYEARFKGLQKTFDRKQKELAKAQEQLDELLEASETAKQSEREKQIQLDALKKAQDEAKAELDRLTGELATQEAQNTRAKLIMSEFSDLAKFEASGLLPPAETEEEMLEKFAAFREALKSTVSANVEQKLVGTSPTDAGSTSTKPARTKEQIYTRLTQLAGARSDKDRHEYGELLAEWDKIQKQ